MVRLRCFSFLRDYKVMGAVYYVKWPGDDRVKMESVASELYRRAGIYTPTVRAGKFPQGEHQLAILSTWADGTSPMTKSQMAKSKGRGWEYYEIEMGYDPFKFRALIAPHPLKRERHLLTISTVIFEILFPDRPSGCGNVHALHQQPQVIARKGSIRRVAAFRSEHSEPI